MSLRELKRVQIFGRLDDQIGFNLKHASEMLGISYRQAKRLWKRFKEKGGPGLIHGLVGQESNRKIDNSKRIAVLQLVRDKYGKQGSYDEFGPQLICEHLAADDFIQVNAETLRRWMIEAGLWQRHRKHAKHRKRRKRKEHFGEMLQLDGSFHEWYEDRGPEGCLMNLVDDATGKIMYRIDEEETIQSACLLLVAWILRYGIPCCLYTDYRNMYGRDCTLEEALEGKVPYSKFGLMCNKLGIKIILANSPQAKGRVERGNKTAQDRLIKKMRLLKISNHKDANCYLEKTYCNEHNERFSIQPESDIDFHRKLTKETDLNRTFSIDVIRTIKNDWVISWNNRLFQLKPKSSYGPAKSTVIVRECLDGKIEIEYRGKLIEWVELPPAKDGKVSLHLRKNWSASLKKHWRTLAEKELFKDSKAS